MSIKLLIITAQTPWGRAEGFILEEISEIERQGEKFLIVPRNPPTEVFHKGAQALLENAIWLPLINIRMLVIFFKNLLTKVSIRKILWAILVNSRNIGILIKNIAVFPKGALVAEIVQAKKIRHIHAHWSSTTATVAYIVSELTNIPWSFTLHRWDIKENNILGIKVKSAKFVRCISQCGKRELLSIVGNRYKKKIYVIHMGVKIPVNSLGMRKGKKPVSKFTLVTPANLLEVKGHRYLIEACSILVRKGFKDYRCFFYGEGPLKTGLKKLIQKYMLTDNIFMPGVLLSHEELIKKYKNSEVDVVILPSIITSKGEYEGIPVSAMEAMAYKIPVISTNTGGIPELLYNEAGIMVNEKSPSELAEAIMRLIHEKDVSLKIAKKGYERVKEEYDVRNTTKKLLELIWEGEV
jgi:glycosyltransferase involved in cell wall biosynthesis